MVDTAVRPDAGLAELLTLRARTASRRRLTLDVVLGLSVALLMALWRPVAWPALFSAALCFAAFGAWAAADRRLVALAAHARAELILRPPVAPLALWRTVRGLAAVVGVSAAVVLVFTGLFGIVGRWIS
ncbi:hypothetical protein [Roseisolibacter agri]|uniref:Uncharacterized protein n=1 Tax=Roseisolibacter agri TaxID=2014610 RepID=A0AA37Q463_9BACT|nr:hypothetical protein [Roseisolibacter agri]GLC26239.1 hypothetical protein rosag_27520 [Roseisolibacter agri]